MTIWRKALRGLAGRPMKRDRLVVPYRGYGTTETWYLRARVLHDNRLSRAEETDAVHRNIINTLRRLRAKGIPGARVHARAGGADAAQVTDDEGYADFQLHLPEPPDSSTQWHPVDLTLEEGGGSARCSVLVPPADAEIGIISDVDDTVIQTDVTRLIAMLRIVMLTNAHTRLPFPGVAAFYRALHRDRNPIFYVSSSPWNFYDLLEHVWEIHDIPRGPLFLKDYDLRVRSPSSSHHAHKLAAIRTLLDTYPRLNWVLIGDSGQQDPEIYRQTVRDFPGRVRAIYIRDVTSVERDREVRAIAEEVEALGVPMLLVRDTVAAAEHAASLELIAPGTLADIYAERAEDTP